MTALACSECGRRLTLINDIWRCANAQCGGHRPEPIQLDWDALGKWTPYKPATPDDGEDRADWRDR